MTVWIGAAPGNFKKGRGGFAPEAIVVHLMDGSLSGTDSWFLNPSSHVSAHYGIGKDGTIHHYVHESDRAYHAGKVRGATWPLLRPGVSPNANTVGIEHEGKPEDIWPDAMYEASSRLIAEIAKRWDIALDNKHIVGHQAIRADKECPGRNCDIQRLIDGAIQCLAASR